MDTTHPQKEPVTTKPAKKMVSVLERSQRRWGWIFISPWIVGFLAFLLIPMVASLIFTFTDFNLIQPDEISFIGFANWERLLNDPDLGMAVSVTLKFTAIALPLSIFLPLGLAALLNAERLWGKRFFRTMFYMPYMIPAVSFVYIWRGVLNDETGWINRFIKDVFQISGPARLNDTTWIYPALFLVGLWGMGNAMLIFLASMQNVPTELYESARVDGAGPFTCFRKITVPLISPVILYNLVLSLIGLFRYFDIPFILKNGTGDPGNATLFYNIHFYRTSFLFQDMGYGATLAWLLFIFAMVTTVGVFYSAKYWVHYAGGDF